MGFREGFEWREGNLLVISTGLKSFAGFGPWWILAGIAGSAAVLLTGHSSRPHIIPIKEDFSYFIAFLCS